MPELPDVVLYVEALERRVRGERLERARLASPFLLRTVDPPLLAAEGRRVLGLRRMGKRIVMELEGDLHLVLHLMIAGRLWWRERGVKVPPRRGARAAPRGRDDHASGRTAERGIDDEPSCRGNRSTRWSSRRVGRTGTPRDRCDAHDA